MYKNHNNSSVDNEYPKHSKSKLSLWHSLDLTINYVSVMISHPHLIPFNFEKESCKSLYTTSLWKMIFIAPLLYMIAAVSFKRKKVTGKLNNG